MLGQFAFPANGLQQQALLRILRINAFSQLTSLEQGLTRIQTQAAFLLRGAVAGPTLPQRRVEAIEGLDVLGMIQGFLFDVQDLVHFVATDLKRDWLGLVEHDQRTCSVGCHFLAQFLHLAIHTLLVEHFQLLFDRVGDEAHGRRRQEKSHDHAQQQALDRPPQGNAQLLDVVSQRHPRRGKIVVGIIEIGLAIHRITSARGSMQSVATLRRSVGHSLLGGLGSAGHGEIPSPRTAVNRVRVVEVSGPHCALTGKRKPAGHVQVRLVGPGVNPRAPSLLA